MPKAIVRLQDGLQAVIMAGNHTWISDEPIIDGGTDKGPSPTEMLVGSLGACMAMTAKLYAQRKNWPLEQVEVEVEYQKYNAMEYPNYEGDAPFVYEFRERVVFHGDLTDEQKARLTEISRKCPVRRVLQNPVFFVEQPINSSV
jgi:putative redox protein